MCHISRRETMGEHNFKLYRNMTEVVNEILAVLHMELHRAKENASFHTRQGQEHQEHFERSTEQSRSLSERLGKAQSNVDTLIDIGLETIATRIEQLSQAIHGMIVDTSRDAQQVYDIVHQVRPF